MIRLIGLKGLSNKARRCIMAASPPRVKIPQAKSVPEESLFFQIKVDGLPLPERQFKFDQARKWRFDFAWPDRMIGVEVDGGTRNGGRHVRHSGFEGDCRKLNAAAAQGWAVFRFTSEMVSKGEAFEVLAPVLRGRARM